MDKGAYKAIVHGDSQSWTTEHTRHSCKITGRVSDPGSAWLKELQICAVLLDTAGSHWKWFHGPAVSVSHGHVGTLAESQSSSEKLIRIYTSNNFTLKECRSDLDCVAHWKQTLAQIIQCPCYFPYKVGKNMKIPQYA